MVQHCLFLLHSTFANPLLPSLFLIVHVRFDTVNYESLSRLFIMHLFLFVLFQMTRFWTSNTGISTKMAFSLDTRFNIMLSHISLNQPFFLLQWIADLI